MRPKSICLFLFILLVVPCLYAQVQDSCFHDLAGPSSTVDWLGVPTQPPSPITTRAIASGPWNVASTWSGGVPADGAVVDIPSTFTVTLSGDTARVKWVQVEGTLVLSSTASSHMFVETLFIAASGQFTLSPSLQWPLTAQVTFIASGQIDLRYDPQQITRGLIAEGQVHIFGEPKLSVATISADVHKIPAGTNIAIDQSAPLHWRHGDALVLTGTYFRRFQPMQDEPLSLNTVNGTAITVDQNIQYEHLRVSSGTNVTTQLHLANLTRNVTFSSESTANDCNRGHVLLANEQTDIENVAFINLGRTSKVVPLDDYGISTGALVKTDPLQVHNKRGRYAVHVHETMSPMNPTFTPWTHVPATPPTIVRGCVVSGTTGWGFVNHSSYVDFSNDVAYNFIGAGFVTEGGDELGNFVNDVAIHGIGQITAGGDNVYRKIRLNFANPKRPQPMADTAFNGEGFWFAGPALHVDGLVANSCNGTGVIWHTTGTVDVTTGNTTGYPYGHYVGFPGNWMTDVWGATTLSGLTPRQFNFGRVVPTDLPILYCNNIQAYADFVGFRLRFVNHDAISWYNESQTAGEVHYGYDTHITGANPTRKTQSVTNLKLWNNEAAITLRYVTNTSFTGVAAVSRLDYDEKTPTNNPGVNPNYAIESYSQVANMSWTNLTFDGYEMDDWIQTATEASTGNSFTSVNYRNHTATGYWEPTNTACNGAAPTPIIHQNNPKSVTITWTRATNATAHMIRYRPTGDQQWSFVTAGGQANSVTINNLSPSRTYQAQLDYACTQGLSLWTSSQTFKQADCTPPGIATQPASTSVQYGSPATLTVVASGSGPFSYQWYQGVKGTTTTPLGTDSDSLTVTPQLVTDYWVRVTSTCDGAYYDSETATVAVYDATPPPIARVQTVGNAVVSQSSISATWSQPTAAGNLLVASISASNVSLIGTFTPPSGWLLAKRYDWNNVSVAIYYLPNAPGGRTSETFAVQNFPDLTLQLAEYSGMATTSVLDATAFDGDNAPRSGIVSSGNAGPTSQARELVFAALTIYAQTAFSNPTSTFNELSDRTIGWNLTTATYDEIVASAGSYGVSATAGGTAQWVGVVVTFKGGS